MKIPYYPGCTLKNQALGFEKSALAVTRALDVELQELSRWNCCGTVFSLAHNDLFHNLAPIRNLIRVESAGYDQVVTLCSMCYNTMKRANLIVKNDPSQLKTLNDFMYREPDYHAQVKVIHLLELLRDTIGYKNISKKVLHPLHGLKVIPYYGCTLTRPKEVAIDDWEEPCVLEDLMEVLGAEVIDNPLRGECCGSYHTVNAKELVVERTNMIISSAKKRGADIMVVSCPLCEFNLGTRQRETNQIHSGFSGIPVLYFTQLMVLAFGLNLQSFRPDLHYVDPLPILEQRGIIEEGEITHG